MEIDHQCVKWNTHINNLLRLLIRGLTSIIPEKVNLLNLSSGAKVKVWDVSGQWVNNIETFSNLCN